MRIQLHSEVVAMKLRWMAEKQNNKADAAPKGVVIWLIKTGVMENILSGIRLYGFNPMPDHKADEKLKNWSLSPHCKQLSKIMNDIRIRERRNAGEEAEQEICDLFNQHQGHVKFQRNIISSYRPMRDAKENLDICHITGRVPIGSLSVLVNNVSAWLCQTYIDNNELESEFVKDVYCGLKSGNRQGRGTDIKIKTRSCNRGPTLESLGPNPIAKRCTFYNNMLYVFGKNFRKGLERNSLMVTKASKEVDLIRARDNWSLDVAQIEDEKEDSNNAIYEEKVVKGSAHKKQKQFDKSAALVALLGDYLGKGKLQQAETLWKTCGDDIQGGINRFTSADKSIFRSGKSRSDQQKIGEFEELMKGMVEKERKQFEKDMLQNDDDEEDAEMNDTTMNRSIDEEEIYEPVSSDEFRMWCEDKWGRESIQFSIFGDNDNFLGIEISDKEKADDMESRLVTGIYGKKGKPWAEVDIKMQKRIQQSWTITKSDDMDFTAKKIGKKLEFDDKEVIDDSSSKGDENADNEKGDGDADDAKGAGDAGNAKGDSGDKTIDESSNGDGNADNVTGDGDANNAKGAGDAGNAKGDSGDATIGAGNNESGGVAEESYSQTGDEVAGGLVKTRATSVGKKRSRAARDNERGNPPDGSDSGNMSKKGKLSEGTEKDSGPRKRRSSPRGKNKGQGC